MKEFLLTDRLIFGMLLSASETVQNALCLVEIMTRYPYGWTLMNSLLQNLESKYSIQLGVEIDVLIFDTTFMLQNSMKGYPLP